MRGPAPSRNPVATKELVRAMSRHGVTLTALASRLGVSHQAVSARLRAGLSPNRLADYREAVEQIVGECN